MYITYIGYDDYYIVIVTSIRFLMTSKMLIHMNLKTNI